MSLVLEMYWPQSIQFESKVTIHTYLSILHNSQALNTPDLLGTELCRKTVYHEYLTRTKGSSLQQFNQPQTIKMSSTRDQVKQETWNHDANPILRQTEYSSKSATRFWKYYTHCLREMDRRKQCPIWYLQRTEGNSELCWRYSWELRMVLYLPNYMSTWRPLFQRNLWNRSNGGFLWSDAPILLDH